METTKNFDLDKSEFECDDPILHQFLMGCLGARLKSFNKQLSKVQRGKNGKKVVHKVRVSSQKTRALLTNFRDFLPDEKYEPIVLGLKSLAAELGFVRELDVLQKEIKRSTKVSYTEKASLGFSVLGDTCSKVILEKRSKVGRAVASFLTSPNFSYLTDFVSEVPAEEELVSLCQNGAVKSFGERVIKSRLQTVVGYDAVEAKKPGEDLHQLRIQLKNLRYTIDDFSCTHVKGYQSQQKQLKKLLKKMGRIHDRQVWIVQIDELLAVVGENYGRDGDEYENGSLAVEILKRKWLRQSLKDFYKLQQTWQNLKREQFWASF